MPHTKMRILVLLLLKDNGDGEMVDCHFAIWPRRPYHTERRHYEVEAKEVLRNCIGFRVPHSDGMLRLGEVEIDGETWLVLEEDWAQYRLSYEAVRGYEGHNHRDYHFKRLCDSPFADSVGSLV